MALASATGASAGHCHAAANKPQQPGFSYFGTDHVKEEVHDKPRNDPGHTGAPGASNCNQTAQVKRADASKP